MKLLQHYSNTMGQGGGTKFGTVYPLGPHILYLHFQNVQHQTVRIRPLTDLPNPSWMTAETRGPRRGRSRGRRRRRSASSTLRRSTGGDDQHHGGQKDTARNVIETGKFVVNLISEWFIECIDFVFLAIRFISSNEIITRAANYTAVEAPPSSTCPV
ncbi:hypothetical protein BC936DRAFT_144852 [Jimgerdemannia flammicorona]|uniref:Uncharacterized protein n=2 Tax=Jimgerdemannia flammicorona TaxID=994334 RepID=A0A433DBG7_9FUNG|nr:hypothetical protein BC936DRAFT_144852 [Jimgerdemannia flammicorona]RUS25892.1 hypothetical protein BC938DRAFT_471496 [Jimgerdemannia flammicorona]